MCAADVDRVRASRCRQIGSIEPDRLGLAGLTERISHGLEELKMRRGTEAQRGAGRADAAQDRGTGRQFPIGVGWLGILPAEPSRRCSGQSKV